MIELELKKKEHSIKMGDICGEMESTITEDTLFIENGEPIGFYLRQTPKKLTMLVDVANNELNSPRVPKVKMDRGTRKMNLSKGINHVQQYSTSLGACMPRAHMRRDYGRTSQVHSVASAKTFIKAMLLACAEGEKLLKEYMPEQYEKQLKLVQENVPNKYQLSNLFSSSISNFNIAAPYHQDRGNLKGCVNLIFSKKENARGGKLHIPDYDAVVDNKDGSLLVYPAWRNMHGVTPIVPITENGYRNSLVFYSINGLQKFMEDE